MGVQTEGAKKGACKYSIIRGKGGFQKKTEQILVDKHIQQQQQGKQQEEALP